ncbi:MAG: serine/threonine protein kinase [Gemmatimonadetes bacterium]|nr:serine/threonine protein kinase [Gemmatimonadota bacterium]NNM06430.1 serine/threonine protein kinase [Gemmatimonadota bacterium]
MSPEGGGGGMKSLASRYALERELGRGGMATVYLARDLKHNREVAVKIIRPDLAAVVGSERFLREIEITAALNHPHILPLLDSGALDDLLYYVMPYVSGGSLRRLLESDAGIPLEAVLRIVLEVASALDYAHDRGVVHRDIKPENILFNVGLAVVGDFGIAVAVGSAPREKVTRTGAALGTLGYMSPEQALGTEALDARTDVYSLGCVAYEMLTGGTPASWPGPEDVKLGRLEGVPSEHRCLLDNLPGRIEQVLTKALALRPGDRYAHAGDLARALVGASERTPSFSEDQVRQLLDRAAELQARESQDSGVMTIGAVEQVAAQVGIPPEHVRKAAEEMRPDATAVRYHRKTPGGQTVDWGPGSQAPVGLWRRSPEEKWDRVVLDSYVDGEIPDEAYPAMVDEIQETLGIMGHASVLANTLTWSPATQGEDSRRVVVAVKSKDGVTRIRVEERFEIRSFRRAFVAVGGVSGAVIAAVTATFLGIADSAMPALLIPFMGLGVVSGVVGTIRFEANTRRPQLEALSGRLREIAEKMTRKLPGSKKD